MLQWRHEQFLGCWFPATTRRAIDSALKSWRDPGLGLDPSFDLGPLSICERSREEQGPEPTHEGVRACRLRSEPRSERRVRARRRGSEISLSSRSALDVADDVGRLR